MGGASRFLMLLTTPLPFLCLRPSALRLARHSRAALAAASSSTSVPLYRLSSPLLLYQSRRRAGFAVRAGESIHTQASVRDDYGERLESPAAAARSWNQWPEWSRLVEHVMAGGYASRSPSLDVADAGDDDSFAASYELPEEFLKAAYACLSFSRDRPVLLKLLSKKDIKTVVKNGSPFLFKNALNSSRRMEIFIDSDASSVLEYERARTVDLMRYLLSYAYNRHFSSGKNNLDVPEAVVASFQNLLNEVVVLSGTVQEPFDSTNRMTTWSSEHSSRLPRQNIEMKRGDWICPRCNFMNFANNIKCRECDEVRPKRQLTGGEWECPQCDFFNYGRNMACLRCDCKRPGEIANTSGHPGPKANLGIIGEPSAIISGNNSNKSDIEHRIAENEEKAERWFSKVSQLDDSSDLSSAIADEDFPEIMPLRKGENRFVVSTRKTPLERRLANAQYRKTSVGDGPVGGNEMLSGNATDKTYDSSISRRLDRILGNAQPVSRDIPKGVGDEINSAQRDPSFVPFVPLPADMFREPHTSKEQQQASDAVNANQAKGSVAGSNGEKEASNPSSTFAERHDAKNSASPISDDDFPDIMPLRKGENRFVVSKKKDRSLTSPQYKRRLAMEQANGSNFVPFVPFPPGYFAKKDHQPEVGSSTVQAEMVNHDGIVHGSDQNMPGKLEEAKHDNPRKTASDIGNVEISQAEQSGNVEYTGRNWSKEYKNSEPYYSNSWDNKNQNQSSESSLGDCSGRMNTSGGSSQQPSWDKNKENWDGGNSQGGGFSSRNIGGNSAPQAWDNSSDRWSSRPSQGSNYSGMNVAGISNPPSWNDKDGSNSSSWGNTSSANAGGSSTPQSERSQSSRESSWGFSGKSLEGSAVTEPDPLDMSEEAKAQRWFRRVAQITDISELSKIPDEDFPEIMPMRKGVNRFVVSKRKTPLERRLTSPQYRRNLPIVSSEPEKISKPEINSNQDKF